MSSFVCFLSNKLSRFPTRPGTGPFRPAWCVWPGSSQPRLRPSLVPPCALPSWLRWGRGRRRAGTETGIAQTSALEGEWTTWRRGDRAQEVDKGPRHCQRSNIAQYMHKVFFNDYYETESKNLIGWDVMCNIQYHQKFVHPWLSDPYVLDRAFPEAQIHGAPLRCAMSALRCHLHARKIINTINWTMQSVFRT